VAVRSGAAVHGGAAAAVADAHGNRPLFEKKQAAREGASVESVI